MGLRFKDGVSIRGIAPETMLALHVANECFFGVAGADCVVTSCNDSQHRQGSLHYIGHAIDLRTKHLPNTPTKVAVAQQIHDRLVPLADFDVVLEYLDKPNEHLHIEYQPKGKP